MSFAGHNEGKWYCFGHESFISRVYFTGPHRKLKALCDGCERVSGVWIVPPATYSRRRWPSEDPPYKEAKAYLSKNAEIKGVLRRERKKGGWETPSD